MVRKSIKSPLFKDKYSYISKLKVTVKSNSETIFITMGPPNILPPRFETGMVCPQHYFKVLADCSGPITPFCSGHRDYVKNSQISTPRE